ncbi:ribosomal protein L33 [Mycoplasmopsis canis UFG4]|uniref:Large ribosomal subunit protein bL33 n=1 Tax=Mycoplasmopsis canis UFG4 TaxID=1131455 RepID=I1A5V9_9BACT|nr:50S ribosomal protein L33 [Mycoplasmopsis canis]EIE39885.1 ribosomal protein L33 [Mycoplasmopsis canis PG 14]EIE40100.1 ribosomal protein L33 [Mycoplasmopsis canis UF31]EIE40312.1 ribosomal protein L33 [Mycoplasmopsis canis UF33]EIE41667.1 ribosomal protein L33 [Mycoplasmopsis canis UFG1]EIE41880.1 ribosomal protein L33 [Mycoplasmopsis canis UFG4]
MKNTNKVALSCEICRRKNYYTNKSAGNQKRLQVKKFCIHCGIHSLHKEEV